jgi:N-acyl-L-homoserine lactone synthetase
MISFHDPALQEPALALMDGLAQLVVRQAAPLRLELAHSKSDRDSVFRLRHRVAMASGWTRPEDAAGGMEHDSYDERAIHIVGWAGHALAATARIVLPREDALLPTEEAFETEIPPRGQVVDWGRLAVAPGHQSPGHNVLWGLLGRSWIETRARGYSELCGVLSPRMIAVYRRMGLDVDVLAPARAYWTEERYPVRFDMRRSAPRLTRLVRALEPKLSVVESRYSNPARAS